MDTTGIERAISDCQNTAKRWDFSFEFQNFQSPVSTDFHNMEKLGRHFLEDTTPVQSLTPPPPSLKPSNLLLLRSVHKAWWLRLHYESVRVLMSYER